jgi:transcription elongation factor Elf1
MNQENKKISKILFKTLLVERKVFCPSCNSELYNGMLMFENESNGQIVCGYCREEKQ